MRAVVFEEFGGPDMAHAGDVPEPGPPQPHQVAIEVRAGSINPIDVKLIAGQLGEQQFPGVTGFDAAGVVTAVGEDVTDLQVGDEVFGLGHPTHAEIALLDVAVRRPEALSWSEAAASGVAGETAARGLTLLGVGEGDTVLIDGASGGVGTFAVQLAVARGATVIATASPAKHDYLRSLGAHPIAYGEGLADRVAEVAPDGVDAVFDVAGRTDAQVLVGIAPTADQVLSIANFGAGESGIRVTSGSEVDAHESLREVAALADGAGIVVPIDKEYDFVDAADGLEFSAGGHVRGKLVVVPGPANPI